MTIPKLTIDPNNLNGTNRVKELIKNARTILELEPGSSVEIDTSRFVNPLALLPLSPILETQGVRAVGISGYCKDIANYPHGFDSRQYTRGKRNQSYLPVITSNVDYGVEEAGIDLQYFRNQYSELVYSICDPDKNAFETILSETIDNVGEHSSASKAYMAAQYYPRIRVLDLCLVDNGIGIPECYRRRGIDYNSDGAYMSNFAEGKRISSTGDINRGNGIVDVINIAKTSGDRGRIVLLSGSGLLVVEGSAKPNYYDLPKFKWPGTVLYLSLSIDRLKYKL